MKSTCPRCNGYVDVKDPVCPHCGHDLLRTKEPVNLRNTYTKKPPEVRKRPRGQNEELPIIFAFIGFFVPIAGIVLYLALNATRPRSASYALKGAFVSIVLYVIATMFLLTLVIIQPGAPR